MKNRWNLAPITGGPAAGFLLAVLVATGALLLQQTELFATLVPLSPLMLAILIGFAAKRILRLAIVFLGFRLSLADIAAIGPIALATILVATTATLLLTLWAGRRLGLPLRRSLLLGSGISICGASAVAAVDGVIGADKEDAAFAIGAITLLGTVFMFLYPLLYRILALPDPACAIWAGASIHEVSQVSAASAALADSAAQALASSVKMLRVLLIVPLSLVLLFVPWHKIGRKDPEDAEAAPARIAIPWFAVFFFAVAINSAGLVPARVVDAIVTADGWAMTVAMAALGLEVSLRAMRRIGRAAFLLGIASSLAIAVLSLGMLLLLGQT